MIIEHKFGIKVSYGAVAWVYKKHKVSYRKPEYAYCRKMEKKKEIEEEQLRTVIEIVKLMKAGKQVIYIDES